jgi:Flp pilus assembly protein TadB
MEIMEAIKFLAFYGMQSVVIALVGITVVAGLYQFVRDRVRGRQEKRREEHIPMAVHEPAERS